LIWDKGRFSKDDFGVEKGLCCAQRLLPCGAAPSFEGALLHGNSAFYAGLATVRPQPVYSAAASFPIIVMPPTKNILFIIGVLLGALSGCRRSAEDAVRQQLQGRWLQFLTVSQAGNDPRQTRFFKDEPTYNANSSVQPNAFAFTLDSVEFYHGIYTENHPDSTRRTGVHSVYWGNWAAYKVRGDSILWEHPADKKWQLLGTIRALRQDSLLIAPPLSSAAGLPYAVTYQREGYKKLPPAQAKACYDEIAFGVSGGLPSAWVLSRSGDALYQRPSRVVGLQQGRLTPYQRDLLFGKFELVDTATAARRVGAGYDGTTVSVCFIRNHQIVAEFNDWGRFPGEMRGAKELLWAYVPAASVPSQVQWVPSGFPAPFAGVLQLDTIVEPDGIIRLSVAENAYLQAELAKSPQAATSPPLPDTVRFWQPVQRLPQASSRPSPTLTGMRTNGRYYRCSFSTGATTTYDLGYDFLERNGLRRKKEMPD